MELNQLVMCPSKEEQWIYGRVKAIQGTKLLVETADGKQELFTTNVLFPVSPQSIESTDDMCKLSELHESLILHNIRQRYMKDIIYTYIGPMIVSVNPYKTIESYGEHLIPEYRQRDNDREELPPHLFSIAKKTLQSLVDFGNSQAVVISGESGAGKTEATKIVLRYLTAQMSNPKNEADLAQMILATNPVLEAFGNAKTIRNNNSSRFGKFIKITYDGTKITSARIDNYLLETTRVISQAPEERNYHIFYQFVKGLPPEEKAKYLVKETCAEYAYLANGDMIVEGIDDCRWFETMRLSLKLLGFSESEVAQIFSLVSAILTLGNITFAGNDQVRIKDEEAFRDFCTLLGVYEGLARQALTVRIFAIAKRGTGYKVPLTYAEAIENRDSLAKLLYHRLFDWLVKKLNKSLKDKPDQRGDTKFIGILDIYGFEIFEKNSLEQFCINYANEKLHQQFNHHMFKAEQEEYIKEGIPWKEIRFKDNQGCIDLIEKPFSGVISLMDEESRVPQGSDEGLLQRLDKKFMRNIWYEHHPKDPDQFMVKHFAGTVTYKITKFLEKNKDSIFPDLLKACKSSSHDIVREFFEGETAEEKPVEETPTKQPTDVRKFQSSPFAPKGRIVEEQKQTDKKQKASVTTKFKEELTNLVNTLASAERHYVRCIKPNEQKKTLIFDSTKVFSQLACNGVFETVTLRKAGFSNRLEFSTFVDRFFLCLGQRPRNKEGIEQFLKEFFNNSSDWAIGKNKTFFRDNALSKLSQKHTELFSSRAIKAQSFVRAYNAGVKLDYLRTLSRSALVLQNLIRKRIAFLLLVRLQEAYAERVRCATILQAQARKYLSRLVLQHLQLLYSSATNLQKHVRTYLACEKLEELREILKKTLEEQRRLAEEYERKRREEEEERKRKEEEERQRLEQERLRIEEERLRLELELQERERIRRELERKEEERRRQEEEERQLEQQRSREEQEMIRMKWQEEQRNREIKEIEQEKRMMEQQQSASDNLLRSRGRQRPTHVPSLRLDRSFTESSETEQPKKFHKAPFSHRVTRTETTSRRSSCLTETQARTSFSSLSPRHSIVSSLKNSSPSSPTSSPTLTVPSPRGSITISLGDSLSPRSRPSSQLIVRSPDTTTAGGNPGFLFDITEEDKSKLQEFFTEVGVSALADLFAEQAIDLETMLSWTDPEKQLQDLGIGQQGVIFRIIRAIEAYNNRKNGKGVPSRSPTFSRANTAKMNSSRQSFVVSTQQQQLDKTSPTFAQVQTSRNVQVQSPVLGPSISFTVHFITVHLLAITRSGSAVNSIVSGMELYVKCDARSFNRRICNYRTITCSGSSDLNWRNDNPYAPCIPSGMSLCFELVDSSSFLGDKKIAECIWDWSKLQTLHNGQHWLPLKAQSECVGELLINISNYPEQDLEYEWEDDILGGDFESLPLKLLPGAYGPLTATLVRLPNEEALIGVLYLHSFSDYFFNAEMAQNFYDEGFAFYALDMRRYGRSMIPNIPPNWTTTLIEYFEEIHIALDYLRRVDGLQKVVLLGHGLGGLVAVLFAVRHPQEADALILNSPLLSLNKNWQDFVSKKRGWFGNQGDPLSKHTTFSSLYHQSLHVQHHGEWSWDECLKPIPGFPIFLGWVDMISDYQKRVEVGLGLSQPVLMLVAETGVAETSWSEELKTADTIMNVTKATGMATKVSTFVKLVAIKDGMHDLLLSSKQAREEAYTKIFDWLASTFMKLLKK